MQLAQPLTARQALSPDDSPHHNFTTAAHSSRRLAHQASRYAAARAEASADSSTLWKRNRWLRSRGQGARCSKLVRPVTAAAGGSLEFSTAGLPGRSGVASFSAATGALSFRQRLEGLGLAGIVAYGILNTLYYTAAFFFVWKFVARVPRGLGLAPTAAKFAEVIGITWAGSQVTKVPRAAGAVMLAPAVDTLLAVMQRRARLRSKRAAFLVVLAVCIAIAAAFYGFMLLAWA